MTFCHATRHDNLPRTNDTIDLDHLNSHNDYLHETNDYERSMKWFFTSK
jgi:hypothetical protein